MICFPEMDPPRCFPRSFRPRGVRRASSLAEEQAEHRELQWALKLVSRCEANLQAFENQAEVEAAASRAFSRSDSRGRGGGRLPQHLQEHELATLACKKKNGNRVAHLLEVLVHCFQRTLRRFHLRKGALAQFKTRMTREEFVAVFGGCVELKQHANGKTFACIKARDTPALNAVLGPLLNVGPDSKHWHCRRCYGRDPTSLRDCAHMKMDERHRERSCVMTTWRLERTAHIDRKATERSTSLGVVHVKCPRGATSVRPSKKVIKELGVAVAHSK